MKVAIHQPEHFPYLGFFEKMKQADLFVILDDVQYKKNNWQNRNKFLNKNNVEEFFSVQVEKEATKKLINEVNVVEGPWRKKTIKKLQQNFNIDVSNIYSHNKLIDIIDNIKMLAKYRGNQAKIPYAEAFNVLKIVIN